MKHAFSALIVTIALGAPLAAQNTPPDPDPAQALLPEVLRGLGLTDIRTRRDDSEVYIYARYGDGWLRAETRGDRLLEVQSEGASLPWSLVEAMLPAAALPEVRRADFARITEIDVDDDDYIDVEGYAADGLRIEAEFTRAGALDSIERSRDDRRALTADSASARLVALGYRDVAVIERDGRYVTALAVNPFGDRVEVRLNEQGQIERERLQDR